MHLLSTVLRLAVLLLPALLSTPAEAGGCVGGLCGTVRNKTTWQLRYTTNPNCTYKKNTCDELCNIWNWDSNGQIVNCKQQYLDAGDSAGGGTVDVDAFTFAERDYCWAGKIRTKGTWTKISTGDTVACGSSSGANKHPCCGFVGGKGYSCC